MRTTLAAAALAVGAALAGCQTASPAASTDDQPTLAVNTLDAASTAPIEGSSAVLVVHGLGCPLCAHNVDEQLAAIAGVKDVEVDLGTGNISVSLAGSPHPSPAQLAAAVDRSGFTLVTIYTP